METTFFNVLMDTAFSSIDERFQNLGEVKDKFGVLLNFPNIKRRRGSKILSNLEHCSDP